MGKEWHPLGVPLGHLPDHEWCTDSLVLHHQLCGGRDFPVRYDVIHVYSFPRNELVMHTSTSVNQFRYKKMFLNLLGFSVRVVIKSSFVYICHSLICSRKSGKDLRFLLRFYSLIKKQEIFMVRGLCRVYEYVCVFFSQVYWPWLWLGLWEKTLPDTTEMMIL